MKTRHHLKLLIERIGGQDPLRVILLDFYQRMAQDPMLGFFFSGKDPAAIALKQQEFLEFAAGIKQAFKGKGPSQAHLELPPILPGHFDRRLVLLQKTLQDHGVAEENIKIWIDFENAFRDVIVSTG